MPVDLGSVRIHACRRWNDTGIGVEQGVRYAFDVTGEWRDGFIRCGPEGHDPAYLRPFARLRRFPRARWCALIATVERRSDLAFAVGGPWIATATGTLTCYANDASFMYWNNRGFVELRVIRAQPAAAPHAIP